jgi:hypothetical protein
VVAQSAAKDAVTAASLLRIKSSRLSAIERKVKIVAKVAAQVEAVDSVVGHPCESLKTTELGIEPVGLLAIFHVAIKKFTGGLVVIVIVVGKIGSPPTIQVEGNSIVFQFAGIDLQVLVPRQNSGIIFASGIPLEKPEDGVGLDLNLRTK